MLSAAAPLVLRPAASPPPQRAALAPVTWEGRCAHGAGRGARALVCRSAASSVEAPDGGQGSWDDDARRRTASEASSGALVSSTGSGRLGPLVCGSLVTRIWGDRPQHDGPINYAQFLEYLVNKRVLRLLIYDHGKNAIGATPARQRVRWVPQQGTQPGGAAAALPHLHLAAR